jgi:hypothetical protein
VSLAPLDHIVFSGVDKIIRGSLAETDFSDAKALFGVKFWGSFVVAKGKAAPIFLLPLKAVWTMKSAKLKPHILTTQQH